MFASIKDLMTAFQRLGVVHAFCKTLAENDNSKQQIYLGGSFDVLQAFPFETVTPSPGGARPNFKAALDFYWLSTDGHVAHAPGAQLILYPQYPEVRLSGFLTQCDGAPNEHLRPVPAGMRRHNNGPDGRVLFFGVSGDGRTFGYLAPAKSNLAQEVVWRQQAGELLPDGIFLKISRLKGDTRAELLQQLSEISRGGWHNSIRLDRQGNPVAYTARNGGGYTLEALLGIVPNGRSEPDFKGWEVKGYSGSKITLMTPEPDSGFYGEEGVEAFVRRFGRPAENDTLYFTGLHKVNARNETTGLTLALRGFNPSKGVIDDVGGAVELLTDAGESVAAWTYAALLEKWNRKHAQAAYVQYEGREEGPAYRYLSPVQLGEGTGFGRYLSAMWQGQVGYDPGSKVMMASTPKSRVKARSQFRIAVGKLPVLYRSFGPVELVGY